MQSILKFSFLCLLVLTASRGLKASTLDKAQAAYSEGRFAEAAELYMERAVDRAVTAPSASLFHNLGLALDREKKLGMAVAAYLRAAQLEPRHGDFEYNLSFLLKQTQDKLDPDFDRSIPDAIWAAYAPFASQKEIYYILMLSFLIFALATSVALLKARYRKGASILASIAAAIALVSASSLSYKLLREPDLGSVSVPKLSAYSGPAESIVIFELHEGAPFQILNSNGEWIKIRLSDQKQGWVKKSGITSFGRTAVILPANEDQKS